MREFRLGSGWFACISDLIAMPCWIYWYIVRYNGMGMLQPLMAMGTCLGFQSSNSWGRILYYYMDLSCAIAIWLLLTRVLGVQNEGCLKACEQGGKNINLSIERSTLMASYAMDGLQFFIRWVLWVSYLDVYSLPPEQGSTVYWAPELHSAGWLLPPRRTIRGQLIESFYLSNTKCKATHLNWKNHVLHVT